MSAMWQEVGIYADGTSVWQDPEQEIVVEDDLVKKLNEMYKKIAEQEDIYAKLQNDLDDAREALLASRTEAFRLYNDLANQKEGE